MIKLSCYNCADHDGPRCELFSCITVKRRDPVMHAPLPRPSGVFSSYHQPAFSSLTFTLRRGEKYFLQIDSHMRFVKGIFSSSSRSGQCCVPDRLGRSAHKRIEGLPFSEGAHLHIPTSL